LSPPQMHQRSIPPRRPMSCSSIRDMMLVIDSDDGVKGRLPPGCWPLRLPPASDGSKHDPSRDSSRVR
jgi:hypothetical protein